ncbi:sce7726 family protein [Pseudomonas sp. H1_F01]
MSSEKSAEARLKAAVIDRLINSGILDENSVLVSELTVDNWTHRTDIVLANGRLWGFELKSEKDSLSRLPAQIKSFSRHFEKFVLVVSKKFEKRVLELIKDANGVGLWVASNNGEITEKIRPRAKLISPEASISLITATELRRLLTANGIKHQKTSHRSDLVDLAKNLPPTILADGARTAIKIRFKEVHDRFLLQRERTDSYEAIPALRRTTGSKRPIALPYEADDLTKYPTIPTEHPDLIYSPSGPVIARSRR